MRNFVWAAIALTACGEVDSGDPFAVTPAARMAALEQSGEWELADRQVQVADPKDWQGDVAFDMTDEEREVLYQSTLDTSPFIRNNGERYEALYVTGDGTTYGRIGPAPDMPVPTEENDFGAWEGTNPDGIPDEDEDDQGDGKGVQAASAALGIGTNATNDRRARVSAHAALTGYPVRNAGAMTPTGVAQANECSGTKVGPRAVLTASHCVWDGNSVRTSGFFHPGKTSVSSPNGGHPWVGTYFRDWIGGGWAFDYAMFYMPDTLAVSNQGWMGMWWANSGTNYNGVISLNNGYPCGPLAPNNCGLTSVQRCLASTHWDDQCDGWMYSDPSNLVTSNFWSDGQLSFDNDGSYGHSGSAIWTWVSGNPAVMAVLATGGIGIPLHGPRMRTTMWNDACSWIADPTVQSSFATHPLCF